MTVKYARLRGYDPAAHTAALEISGGSRAYLEGVKVARNIAADEMVNGRGLVVVFLAEHNAQTAVVVAVFT